MRKVSEVLRVHAANWFAWQGHKALDGRVPHVFDVNICSGRPGRLIAQLNAPNGEEIAHYPDGIDDPEVRAAEQELQEF